MKKLLMIIITTVALASCSSTNTENTASVANTDSLKKDSLTLNSANVSTAIDSVSKTIPAKEVIIPEVNKK